MKVYGQTLRSCRTIPDTLSQAHHKRIDYPHGHGQLLTVSLPESWLV